MGRNFLDYIPELKSSVSVENGSIIIHRRSFADKIFYFLLKRPLKSIITLDEKSHNVIGRIDGRKDLYEIFKAVSDSGNAKELNAFCKFINIIKSHGIIKLSKKKTA